MENYTKRETIDNLNGELSAAKEQLHILQSLFAAPRSEQNGGADIAGTERFVRSVLFPFLDQLEFLTDKKGAFDGLEAGLLSWKNLRCKPWLEHKAVIAIMGRFSSGKSSLINALMNEELLAVDVNEMTAVPAYLSYGERPTFKYTDLENQLRTIDPGIFKNFSRQSLNGFNLAAMVKNFIVEHPVSSLRRISILDTPGYDAINEEDQRKALEVLSESQYVFWVVDINDGDMSDDALQLIRKNLQGQKLYIILSKADQKPESARMEMVAQVEGTLRGQGIPFETCLLYSRKFDHLKVQLASVISGLAPLENKSFKETLRQWVRELKEELNSQYVQYKKAIADDEREKENIESEITSMLEDIRDGKEKLVKKLNNMTYAMDHQIEDGFVNKIVIRPGDFFSTYNTMVEAFNESNGYDASLLERLDDVSHFGVLAANISRNQQELERTEARKEQIFSIEEELNRLFK